MTLPYMETVTLGRKSMFLIQTILTIVGSLRKGTFAVQKLMSTSLDEFSKQNKM
jgi:hypothetical protein